VGKRSFLLALVAVLAMLSLPAATALAAPATSAAPAAGSHTSAAAPPLKVNVGAGKQLTLSTSGATCKAMASKPGTSQCSVIEQVPLGDLSAAAASERAADLKSAAAAATEAPDAAAAIPTSGPARCDFTDTEIFTKDSSTNPDRLTSCSDVTWAAVNYEKTDFPPYIEPTGFFWWEDQQWDIFRAAKGNWTHGLVTLGYLAGASGTLDSGVTADLESSCDIFANICSATSAVVPDPQTIAIRPGARHSYEWTESDAGASSTTADRDNLMYPDLGVFLEDISTTPAKEASDTGKLHGRCDTMATSHDGCVNYEFIPTVVYSGKAHALVNPVAQHIYNAERGGLAIAWGVPASHAATGRPLTRDTKAADITANRRKACAKVKLKSGQQCDEYPLASTFEGAAFQSVFSAVAVPASANQSQGGTTSTFYASDRVIDDDAFYVLAILKSGAQSW
jgi:hypothetical protein